MMSKTPLTVSTPLASQLPLPQGERQKLYRIWYQHEKSLWNFLLIPLSKIYASLIRCRKKWVFKAYHSKLPIIVVGNLTVGGGGKTPAILALIALLHSKNLKVGVVSRGYPINPAQPILLNEKSTAAEVGDEPLLIYRRTHLPVCVCGNRMRAIQQLEQQAIDIILSDDGLQNFSFKHDIEIVLVDAERGFGNKKLLPAGPLREPLTRLKTVDFIVEKTYQPIEGGQLQLRLRAGELTALVSAQKAAPTYFQHKKVIAMTGIANPESFFNQLRQLGIHFEAKAFCDHYAFTVKDFAALGNAEIIMTEKDAVKCLAFADARFWYLQMEGRFSENFENALILKLRI